MTKRITSWKHRIIEVDFDLKVSDFVHIREHVKFKLSDGGTSDYEYYSSLTIRELRRILAWAEKETEAQRVKIVE